MGFSGRWVVVVLVTAVFAIPSFTDAQQASKVPKIGYLSNSGGSSAADSAFLDALRDLGYINGKNVVIEARYSGGKSERFPEFSADLVRLGVQVIAAWSPTAVGAARQATSTVPIVGISLGSDPVSAGWIGSMARPKFNLTGITGGDVWLNGKRMELLKEAIPTITRVAVLADPTNPEFTNQTREVEKVAQPLKVRAEVFGVGKPTEFGKAFADMKARRVDALLVVPDGMFWAHRADIVRMATDARIPAMYWTSDYTELGGLMSYAESLIDIGVRAAGYVDKILKGSKPADLPVEQPVKFELVINLKAAKGLNLTFPPSVLARADQVIQ
jgi:putative tryptophan/tyrosine transport system substrate-binding protein